MSTTYTGTLFDAHDELGHGFADVDYTLFLSIEPADDGVVVALDAIEIDAVRPQDGTALSQPLTADEIDAVKAWVDRKTGEDWATVQTYVLAGEPGSTEPGLDEWPDDQPIGERMTFETDLGLCLEGDA